MYFLKVIWRPVGLRGRPKKFERKTIPPRYYLCRDDDEIVGYHVICPLEEMDQRLMGKILRSQHRLEII